MASQVSAEGVAQDVWETAILGERGCVGVAGDDAGDVADVQRARPPARWRESSRYSVARKAATGPMSSGGPIRASGIALASSASVGRAGVSGFFGRGGL